MAEQLISDLRALDDDDGIEAVLQKARDAGFEDGLAFTTDRLNRRYLTWDSITTQLADAGRTFGDVFYQQGRTYRAIAYETTKDVMWTTSDTLIDFIAKFRNYSSITFETEARSKRDWLITAVETSSNAIAAIAAAESELERIARFRQQDGLYFDTRWGVGIHKAKFFSWESMTTDLGNYGHAFGDVVDKEGHRAVAYDGEMWVADPGRAKTVHKL